MVKKRQHVTLRALTLAVLSAPLLMAAHPAQAQAETVLYTFDGIDGGGLTGGLASDGAGNFYGATVWGGAFAAGNVYKLSPNGSGGWKETVLYTFTGGEDGCNPYSYLVFNSTGNLYGTAYYGGANGLGVVFELSPGATAATGWKEKVLHSFAGGTDGGNPYGGLIFDRAGNLYGTTDDWVDRGPQTVFELSPSGDEWMERVIYYTDINGGPGLAIDTAGNIFGIGLKKVFELSPNGDGGWNATVIHTFTGAPKDGSRPFGIPVFDTGGNLYGTTYEGGDNNYGTVYKLTHGRRGKWTEKILHSFEGGDNDGSNPFSGVVFDAAGNIYGTTTTGGPNGGAGTVFELAPVGGGRYEEKVLWNFDYTDGSSPHGSLILDRAGNLFGTAYSGSRGDGVVFEVTP